MFLVLPLIPIIGGLLGGVATGLGTNALWEAFKPKEPTLADMILSIMPQVMFIVIVVGCVLMYQGIMKYYIRKKRTFVFPIVFSIIYFLLMVICTSIFNNFIVIALAVDIALTIYFLMYCIQIYKGNKSFKSILVLQK